MQSPLIKLEAKIFFVHSLSLLHLITEQKEKSHLSDHNKVVGHAGLSLLQESMKAHYCFIIKGIMTWQNKGHSNAQGLVVVEEDIQNMLYKILLPLDYLLKVLFLIRILTHTIPVIKSVQQEE